MIKFMRDKTGNLYSVKDGKVTGRITSIGDSQQNQPETGRPETKKRRS